MVRQWGYRVAQRAKERTLASAASYSKQNVEQTGADSTPSGARAHAICKRHAINRYAG